MSYVLDQDNFLVRLGPELKIAHLPEKEFLLLEALHDCRGELAHYDYLMSRMWPNESEPDGAYKSIRVYVNRLRTKVGGHINIVTKARLGYAIYDTSETKAGMDKVCPHCGCGPSGGVPTSHSDLPHGRKAYAKHPERLNEGNPLKRSS